MRAKLWITGIGLVVFLCSQLVVARIIHSDREGLVETNRYVGLEQLSTVRARLEGLLQANLIAIRQLRTELTLNPVIDEQRFRRIASSLLSPELHIRHLALGKNYRIVLIYPLEGNENAIGFDYRSDPEQLSSFLTAVSSGEITLNGPVQLTQGGTALIARVPVAYKEGEPPMIISQVIDHERLFRDAGLVQHPFLNISLRGIDGSGINGAIILGDSSVWQGEPITQEVHLPTGSWALAAAPINGSWIPENYPYALLWLIGTFVSCLLAVLTSLVLFNQHRLRDAFRLITRQARFDTLTELPNRHYFQEQLSGYLDSCERRREKCALLFIDLDHFKEVNDALGHAAGDALLVTIANRLRTSLRKDDIVARLGGDEFVVVMKNITEAMHAQIQAQKLLQHIHEPVTLGEQDVIINSSIGIAIYPSDGETVDELLKSADLAMYNAKNTGRGTTSFFNAELREQASSHVELHHAIMLGLKNDEFFIEYQPVVNSKDGSLHSVEALVRWQHPQHGLMPPKAFIPIAEKSGAIRELGNFVLNQTCLDIPKFRKAKIKGRVAVNFSSHQFYDRMAVDAWFAILEKHDIKPENFTFEITESMLLPDRERQRDLLLSIHHKGIHLAIDDFGTGYSSTSYLQHFPVSMLKIDKSFVDRVPEDKHQTALLTALIHMARALEIDVVAEGVEQITQVEFLNKHCADLIQGFYFARPMPIAAIIERYGEQN
ncbi:bifunctional diguanylate cyclase/phosphodiesterase [Aliidiomarina iranensis]|uniref:Bifunctional diguanylate cyclase/phosphodiesterase n=1 Tax=Aliidiomarina iranensis TaxID=1434071 RepID=A0A432W2S0_9GAMM|nr:EAL domain-containing protein [Aliidiomarina iranensis]RUO23515.1 bifunctional diguanylate cyclase/phosphodiesterase [Aliidiomarina iranensis]